ncbi:MAG TPA: carboxypeptidase regulatory-like domain-containing protein [Coriobacteriia bacterium]|nr:carboxypeptidase regulatory-like domain-containing protein [Coriobacteriia bacterium]
MCPGGRRICAILLAVVVGLGVIALDLTAPTGAWALSKPKITSVTAKPKYVSRYVAPHRVVIAFKLSRNSKVTIKVLKPSGATAKTLISARRLKAGHRATTWNLKYASGKYAASGTYRVSIKAANAAGSRTVKTTVVLDNAAPYAYFTSVSPASIVPRNSQQSAVIYRTTDNMKGVLSATLEVLNGSGATVRTLAAIPAAPGTGRTFTFDGRDATGAELAAGHYSLRILVKDLAGNSRYSSVSGIDVVAPTEPPPPPPPPVDVTGYGPERTLDATAYSNAAVRADVVGDVTHVVWNDSSASSPGVRYRRLDRFGNTLVAPSVVASTTLSSDSPDRGYPDVGGAPDGGAFVVWRGRGTTSSRSSIWLAYIDPTGRRQWLKPIIDEPGGGYDTQDPRVAVGPNGIAHIVCWRELSPNAVYYCAYRKDGVCAAGLGTIASGNVSNQRKFPNIAVDALGRVHIVWFDAIDHPDNAGYRELYYTRFAFTDGIVAPEGGGSIMKRRETVTTQGFSPRLDSAAAPEMATGADGTLHVVWQKQVTAQSSEGILYRKLAPNGTPSIESQLVFDGSSSSSQGRYGWDPTVAARAGGGVDVAFTAKPGLSAADRIWQTEISASGVASAPHMISDGKYADALPCIGASTSGSSRLVYLADTDVLRSGTVVVRRVTYKDMNNDAAANDVTRSDLEVDAAMWSCSSALVPPRQNSPVTIGISVMNAGWVPSLGGTAYLEHDGVPVDSATIPVLAPEDTVQLQLHWTIPSDATDSPADLAVRVVPSGGAAQTTAGNDLTSIPLKFLTPPTTVNLYAQVFDETGDEDHFFTTPVMSGTASLTGTTNGGAPFFATATTYYRFGEFLNVPLGNYTMTHNTPGYIAAAPSSIAIAVQPDPADNYKVTITPNVVNSFWVNTWGSIEGTAVVNGTSTPISGVSLKLVESGVTTTSASPTGAYRFSRLAAGNYTLRAVKAGYERKTLPVTVNPAAKTTLQVPLQTTTQGYFTGAIVDAAGNPAINDPDSSADDPRLILRLKSNNEVKFDQTLHEGTFDITVDAGTYTAEYSALGYVTYTNPTVTITAGLETDGTEALDLDISNLTHEDAKERWGVAWTQAANFGGSQPPGSEIDDFNIDKWNGLFRFDASCDHQTVGTAEHVREVSVEFLGEAFEWSYFYGVDPPGAPTMFEYGDSWPWEEDKYEPPSLITGGTLNRTGVRCDGIDVVDQRSWTTVASIRSQWYSDTDWVSHRYGEVTPGGDGGFTYTTTPPPWNQQVLRFWITIGMYDDSKTPSFKYAPFADYSGLNFGDMMDASGYKFLQLYYRPVDDMVWVEPAYAGYPLP